MTNNTFSHIGFLGAGNMANALIQGLLKSKHPASQIFAYDIHPDKVKKLSRQGLRLCKSPEELLAKAGLIVLATKPQDLKAALEALKASLKKHLLISIAAGIDLATLSKSTPSSCKIIRSMPNNPALIGEGITALYSASPLKAQEKSSVEKVFKGAGDLLWVTREEQLDAVTGLSGSGPAYVYQFVEALTQAGIRQGLPEEMAYQLSLKTLLGSALTLLKTKEKPKTLIPLVTSKKGTTLAGLAALKKNGFNQSISRCVEAATRRAKEIRKELKRG